MADTIKIGSLDISAFKVGSSDCKIYLGDILLYSGGTTPPTPTYEWVSYSEGDTVPSSTIYGVKLYMDNPYSWAIDFGFDSGISFSYDGNDWTAFDIETFEQIDISSYFDADENYYTILFSDLGYGGLTIYSPEPEVDTFEYDIDFYQEYQPTPPTPTLKWVTFNTSDRIPTTLNIYGVKGNAYDLSNALVNWFTASRVNVDININGCYSDTVSQSDNVELIFSEIGTCSDYYNLEFEQVVYGGSIQLYIYA